MNPSTWLALAALVVAGAAAVLALGVARAAQKPMPVPPALKVHLAIDTDKVAEILRCAPVIRIDGDQACGSRVVARPARVTPTSPSVGQDPGRSRPVDGAPRAPTPGADDPTVGDPTDVLAARALAVGASVESPVGGDAPPASPPTAAAFTRHFVLVPTDDTSTDIELMCTWCGERLRRFEHPTTEAGSEPLGRLLTSAGNHHTTCPAA